MIKDKITDVKPKLFLTSFEKNEAKKLIKNNGIDLENKPLIMINILGKEESKTYADPQNSNNISELI